MSQQPSGWYDDPSNAEMLRYWDGVSWTHHTAPRRSPTVVQPPASGGTPPASAPTTPIPQSPTQQIPMPQSPAPPTSMPPGSGWQSGAPAQPGASGYPPAAAQYPGAPAAADWMHGVVTTADGVPLASWGRRFGAWLIDGVILAILSYVAIRLFVPTYLTLVQDLVDAASRQDNAAMEGLISRLTGEAVKAALVSWLVSAVYCIAFWTTTAQTPGKMVLGISVRRADRPGVLDIVTALRRRLLSVIQILPVVAGIYPLVSVLDGLWPLWDNKRQALHDKIATTQVVMGKQPRTKG